MEPLRTGNITIQCEDRAFKGYINGQGPGVLVLHAWWGLTPFFKELCDRLAAEGFCALAPDLHQGKTARTIAEAEALMAKRDYERTRIVVATAANYLQSRPEVQGSRLALVGFSMGAAWAIALSSLAPGQVAAAVLFYGVAEADFSTIRAAFQGHFGEEDDDTPIRYADQMEAEMRAAGLQVTFYRYSGVGHWFFESDQPAYYNENAAVLAWQRTLSFLREQNY